MKFLVTGSSGYIGCVLSRLLATRGHEVVGYDLGIYSSPLVERHLRCLVANKEKDLAQFTVDDLKGVDWCFHLAGISNDPSAELSEDLTMGTNVEGTRKVAEACCEAGVPMIFASTASVYGAVHFSVSTEDSTLAPISLYGESKVRAEGVLRSLAEERGLRCIILRQATVFGWSPRMRYDLVVNSLLMCALAAGRLVAYGGGETFRPLVYVGDVARTWTELAETRTDRWWAEQDGCPTFNVAHEEAGKIKAYRISELVWWMKLLLEERGVKVEMIREGMGTPDRRDYVIDTSRLRHAGCVCRTGITPALDEMLEHIRAGECADLTNALYYNHKWLQSEVRPEG